MAEAVKPITKKSEKKPSSHVEHKQLNDTGENDDDNELSKELTDANLQARLKSLTSFVNNLEPSGSPSQFEQTSDKNEADVKPQTPTINNTSTASAPELPASSPTPASTKYYDMIAERAMHTENDTFRKLQTDVNVLKLGEQTNGKFNIQVDSKLTPNLTQHQQPLEQQHQQHQQVYDYNLDLIKQVYKLEYPRLNWNNLCTNATRTMDGEGECSLENELVRFYENDQYCKELEVYYKCKYVSRDQLLKLASEFVQKHSLLDQHRYKFLNDGETSKDGEKSRKNHEFYELLRDYYEARRLVLKCQKDINDYKLKTIVSNLKKIWTFEKYTIESFGICGDQQRCKHELTSEKCYLNKIELNKLQSNLYELRFNLVKNGLISSLFCSKLTKLKIESYLNEYLTRFNQQNNDVLKNSNELKPLLDILFYFYRRQNRSRIWAEHASHSATSSTANGYYEVEEEAPDNNNQNSFNIGGNQMEEETNADMDEQTDEIVDELFKMDLNEWIKSLSCLLLNNSEQHRMNSVLSSPSNLINFSNLHFDNVNFLLQHLLRSPDSNRFSYLLQFPSLLPAGVSSGQGLVQTLKLLNLNSSKSDQLVNLYFDSYIKLIASFSFEIVQRNEFLFLNTSFLDNIKRKLTSNSSSSIENNNNNNQNKLASSSSNNWLFIDLEGETENVESLLVEINEDDLIALYYQIPFNSLFSFLWTYLEFQTSGAGQDDQRKTSPAHPAAAEAEFRARYVAMKIISFLDCLSRLSIRSLLIYNKLKYKNFLKLIGKTLREIIKFMGHLLTYSRESNRVEYDQFIKRIITTIIYTPRLKSVRWTILNQLNIGKLNLATKWLLLSIMCGIDVYHPHFERIFYSKTTDNISACIMQSCQNDLEAILESGYEDAATMGNNSNNHMELISFMRTLHFLIDLDAQANDNTWPKSVTEQTEIHQADDDPSLCDPTVNEFMSCVVRVIFKIAYCYESTKEICSKEGNCLLFAICSTYPNLIGIILDEIDRELLLVGRAALNLCDELPFGKWLPYINLESDLLFLEKCLLYNPTNSVLFTLASKLIDNLDFNVDTGAKCAHWLKYSNTISVETMHACGVIDMTTIFKLKLAIMLFELHTRLTNYNYFNNRTQPADELFDSEFVGSNRARRDDLQLHYNQLSKDKRLQVVYWIWYTFYRMKLYLNVATLKHVDYIEELCTFYSTCTGRRTPNNNSYLSKFYQTYLSKKPDDFNTTFNEQASNKPAGDTSTSNDNSNQIASLTVLNPKCPLENYIRLALTYMGHELVYVFDQAIYLIQTMLATNKKDAKLQTLTYLILFDWFDNLLSKHVLEPSSDDDTTSHRLLDEFRLVKKSFVNKLSQLLLTLFNPAINNSHKLIDNYCSKLYQRLNSFSNVGADAVRQRRAEENRQNYLYFWIELLITSVKNWHRYKNVVKLIDFLIAYSFNDGSAGHFINVNLLSELVNYVRADFGVLVSPGTEQDQSNENQTDSASTSHQSSWIHSSSSWLSSSLSYVVSTTTSTVGAALSAASGLSSASSNEFSDSSQLQFTYDKRLYKECPYVGFYLSLCEERIEVDLGLWSTFLSFLLGVNSNLLMAELSAASNQTIANTNSSEFIQSCWRKTLTLVNKTNTLTLNFPPQRLMLFKWCERAVELPHEHPLLILYWQKFFNIYLDKDFYASLLSTRPNNLISGAQPSHRRMNPNNFDLELTSAQQLNARGLNTADSSSSSGSPIVSPTFRLFTSTSQMNSLLKQLKKQLELTSQHYAYQMKPNNSQATAGSSSAPLSNYHFTETISKLYYALSLWVDETRLHDPNLYLPALPVHYEPNLLAKIFTKQCDFWIEYVDSRQIADHMHKIVHSISDSTIQAAKAVKPARPSSKPSELFFAQIDRLVVNLPSLKQINLRFRSPIREKFGDSIETLLQRTDAHSQPQISQILTICEHMLKSIFKYNKDLINHTLNHMLRLDDKLCNKLLVHLWHNEMCEKYIQVPCTSIINPMHQCTRPAMVKFVYEVATKRDQLKQEIKENRLNHDKLIMNFIEEFEQRDQTLDQLNKHPYDDLIVSMVAMNQLIKRLLKNYYNYQLTKLGKSQSTNQQTDATNNKQADHHTLLSKLFYMLIELYETSMNHPNDVLNPAKSMSPSPVTLSGWSILIDDTSSLISGSHCQSTAQINSDSIHLFMFDLIHMMGANFIQNNNIRNVKKANQQMLLEKIIYKLTSTINVTNLIERNMAASSTANNNNISTRRSSNMLLTITRNKLSLMALCAQYVEPNDLDLFNDFYMKILASISSILLNETNNRALCDTEQDPNWPKLDENEMINQKFSIILQLLGKFSFLNLNRLLESCENLESVSDICTHFVTININFLTDLNLECLKSASDDDDLMSRRADVDLVAANNYNGGDLIVKRDLSLKQIIDQCTDNYVSILNISYPFYFDYLLKRCLEFSSKPFALKYGARHLSRFVTIYMQNEMLYNLNGNTAGKILARQQYESTFVYLSEFFAFERTKFRSQKRSFYSHWCVFATQLADIYSNLFTNYFEKFVMREIESELQIDEHQSCEKFNAFFKVFTGTYGVWIEPSSLMEITSVSQMNVKEIYETINKCSNSGQEENPSRSCPPHLLNANPHVAIMIMFSSFLNTFNSFVQRLQLLPGNALKNFTLNKLIHFYYEKIACELNFSSIINDNTLDCYHKCLSRHSSSWFGNGLFEPDYQTVNAINELCYSKNTRLIKHIAFDLVCYFDLNRITDSYFRQVQITPVQINDLLKCLLQVLAEFCLRDAVRESNKFDSLLRPVYNQAEVLQCWSMLSDTSYSSVVLDRFCPDADYVYAFASRGTDRGLLMNLLKSAAEFYTLADRNSLSCFSSAKRRCYLKAICHLLLKPTLQTIKTDLDSFQNCIMNLLTDIETFSISATSTNNQAAVNDESNSNLRQEIQLLIDECLALIVSDRNKTVSDQYKLMFESWLCSSKDSPILTHFINRISRNYSLLVASNNSESYCNLLELCLEVFFETNRDNLSETKIEAGVMLNRAIGKESQSWKLVMSELDFKLNASASPESLNEQRALFEFKLCQNASYLTLNSYMIQRYAQLKAIYGDSILDFYNQILKYSENLIGSFMLPTPAGAIISKPKPGKEEKFIVVLNRLIEFYLSILYEANSNLVETKIGEQIMRLSALLTFYGEDTLSNQNPTNDGQYIGSELLSSFGLNILAKKSQFSVQFRFYCRCMAICLLKQILILNESDRSNHNHDLHSTTNTNSNLFPNLKPINSDESPTVGSKPSWFYKIRMNHTDIVPASSHGVDFDNPSHKSTSTPNLLSTSLPNASSHLTLAEKNAAQSTLHTVYNQHLKQAAYQFHLIYQTKAYTSQPNINELLNYVNQHLNLSSNSSPSSSSNSEYFCLPQCFNMSVHLCAQLFKDKFYLF